MNPYLNNKTLLELALKWKYHLGIIAVLAGIIATVFSSPVFLKPKFKSMAIVYPENLGEKSEESYTEQMLEMLNSGDIRDSIIRVFNLPEHYKISPNYKYYKTAIYGKFADNISFRKTENEAVRIEVLDTDPQIACNMVDSILGFYDKKVRLMHNIKFREEYQIRKKELDRLRFSVDSIVRRLSYLGSQYGVLEVGNQSDGLSQAYFEALASGRANEEMRTLFRNIAEKGPETRGLLISLEGYGKQFGEAQMKHDDAYREMTKKITYSSVVTPPYPADKKAWPKRSVIVVISVILTLIMAMVVIGVIENRNNSASS
jgi:hypothetical protein